VLYSILIFVTYFSLTKILMNAPRTPTIAAHNLPATTLLDLTHAGATGALLGMDTIVQACFADVFTTFLL
jgi:hypothetical protein